MLLSLQVLILLDEEEYFQHFLLPEMISRSTTHVTFFVFTSPMTGSGQSVPKRTATVKEIINHLEEEQLVDVKLVDVKQFINPEENKNINFDLKEIEKSLHSERSFANLLARCVISFSNYQNSRY